jgi:hypothetical protein
VAAGVRAAVNKPGQRRSVKIPRPGLLRCLAPMVLSRISPVNFLRLEGIRCRAGM